MPSVACEKSVVKRGLCEVTKDNTSKVNSVNAELRGILNVVRSQNGTGASPDAPSECLFDEILLQSDALDTTLDLCAKLRMELLG